MMFKTGRLVSYSQGLRNSLAYNGPLGSQGWGTAREDLMQREDLRPKQQGEQMVTIADKAKAIIYGDREKTFGKPESNLGKIAQLWSAYLDKELTAYDVSNLMILLKVARLQNANGHEDSLVDVVGYALIQERMKDADKVVTNT